MKGKNPTQDATQEASGTGQAVKPVITNCKVSVTGNIYCPVCGEWTGKNINVDHSPFRCEKCGTEIRWVEVK